MADNSENNIPVVDEINLSEIDWNKLSITEFHDLEQKMLLKHKSAKLQSLKNNPIVRSAGNVIVSIKGNNYSIKTVLFNRLKKIKSQKSKDALIQEIIDNNNPIENL